MKKLITSLFALAVMTTASAQMSSTAQARVYAYDLKLIDNSTSYKVEFKTNTEATSAKVIVYNPEVKEETFTFEAVSLDKKMWNANILASDVNPCTKYNFKVEATADDVTEFTFLTEKTSQFKFFRAFAVAIDNSPSSPYFGRIYVPNQGSTDTGLYTFNPQLDEKEKHVVDVIGDKTTTKGTSPRDMAIASDGRIFVSDYTADINKTGVYCINPKDFTHNQVFQGTPTKVTAETPSTKEGEAPSTTTSYAIKNGDIYVGGRAGGIGLRGEGENIQLFVNDHAKSTSEGMANSDTNDYICRYDIGTSSTWSSAPSWSINKFAPKSGKATLLARGFNSIDVVKNGFWVSAQRGANLSTYQYTPLFYYSEKTGCREFEIVTDMPNLNHTYSSKNGGLAVNEDLGLIAYTLSYPNSSGTAEKIAYVRILSYVEKEDGTVAVEHIGDYDVSSLQSTYINALDFDYAGNLYAVSNISEYLSVFALPTSEGGNVRETPGQGVVEFSEKGFTPTSIETIESENAPVEYYNLQGVKVENPENGIFIKKQGRKTTKVIL